MIKIVATRCQILRLKCTKLFVGPPRPHWGSLQRSPRPPRWILGGLLLRGRGKDESRRKGRGGKGREGKGGREGWGGEGWGGEGGAGSAPKLKLGPPELFSWRQRCITLECATCLCNHFIIVSVKSVVFNNNNDSNNNCSSINTISDLS